MRIIIKICHMGNFLFREISAVTESQRGAECAIRQKGKKTAHGLRYDCPDGRLSSIILHVVYPLIRQSYDQYKLYIPDVVREVKWKKRSDQKRKGQQFILVDENMPIGVK